MDCDWDLVDVFCGGGCFSFGARTANMKPIAAIDCSHSALNIYKRNHSECATVSCQKVGPDCPDISLPDDRDRLHVHLSPPCQNLSNAKKKATGNLSAGISMLTWSIDKGVAFVNDK